MANISKFHPGNKKTIVAGHFCLDILPDLSTVPEGEFYSLFRPGRLLETGMMNIATGGAASNTGISLNKLGIDATILARLGNDGFGKMAQTHLGKFVPPDNNHLFLLDKETTSYTVIINPPGVDRIFLHHPGANDTFTDQDVDFTLYKNHSLFHYGYPQLMKAMFRNDGEKMVALFKNAKEQGLTTSLDTTFPDPSTEMGQVNWDKILRKTLRYVDIFCPSFEEAFFMLDRDGYVKYTQRTEKAVTPDDVIPLLEKMLNYGVKIALIKLGQAGSVVAIAKEISPERFGKAWFSGLYKWQNRMIWAPSFEVDVVGTTGAGDATIAGFLGSILTELPLEETLLMAMGVGGCNVEALDSVSAVRSWEDTANRINLGWTQNQLDLQQYKDWEWSPAYCLWEKQVK